MTLAASARRLQAASTLVNEFMLISGSSLYDQAPLGVASAEDVGRVYSGPMASILIAVSRFDSFANNNEVVRSPAEANGVPCPLDRHKTARDVLLVEVDKT
jgi:hypothetical protein